MSAIEPPADRPVFDAPNILWYFGGLTATFACLEVFGSVHDGARGLWILLVALGFLAGYGLLAVLLLRSGAVIAGGVIAAWSVVFAPVAASAVEQLVGATPASHPSVSLSQVPAPSLGPLETFAGHTFALPAVLVVAGLAAYVLTRFAFALAFVAVGLLVCAEFLLPAVVNVPSPSDEATALIVFGLALLATGLALDLRSMRRDAFWFHLVGLVALTGGLTYHAVRHSSWGWQLILVAGIAVLAFAALLRRATWTLFGIAGLYAPLAHYAVAWFGNLGATAAIAVIGFGFVALGVVVRGRRGSANDGGLQDAAPA